MFGRRGNTQKTIFHVLCSLRKTTTIIIIVPKNNKNPFSRKVNVMYVRCEVHPEILWALCFIQWISVFPSPRITGTHPCFQHLFQASSVFLSALPMCISMPWSLGTRTLQSVVKKIVCSDSINPQATNVIYIYMEHPFLMFLDHTQRRSTVGRTPLDE